MKKWLRIEKILDIQDQLVDKVCQELMSIDTEDINDLWNLFKARIVPVVQETVGMKTTNFGKKKGTACWGPKVYEATDDEKIFPRTA